MASEPIAFLSYAHTDDEHDGHSISAFRKSLEGALRIHTGQQLTIFQDRDLAWGEAWRDRIDGSLDTVAVLIPILTPSFFVSSECRRELTRFLERERRLGRRDLILPVYWVETAEVDDSAVRDSDDHARELASRQRADWRDLRFEALTTTESRREIARLAARIRDTIRGVTPLQSTEVSEATRRAKSVPRTHIVDKGSSGGDVFSSLSAAIQVAQPSDRILVRPGVYSESIVIDEPVEIIGEGPRDEIVIESKSVGEDTLLFEAYRGRVSNLTIRQVLGGERCAVRIARGKLHLEQCEIRSLGDVGIAVVSGAEPTVRQNLVHRCNCGISVSDGGSGIYEDNNIVRNRDHGVVVARGGNPILRNNRISRNTHYGVMVISNGLGLLEDNDLDQNGWSGAGILAGANPTLRRNRITSNSHYAIWITAGGLGTIVDNDLTDNEWGGMGVTDGGNPTVRGNRIMGNNQFGVWVNEQGLGTFVGNSVIGNASGPWNIADDIQTRLRISDNTV